MKQGNLEKWTDIGKCQNLLFFSQLVGELLFDYSIPSNRISTLNSHYLCLDAISAISGIEDSGVPEGTLKPIMEELYAELKKDPAFPESNRPIDYFVKIQNNKCVLCNNISDINYIGLKNIAFALNNIFFNQNDYYNRIKERIISIVERNDCEEQQVLFRLTKSLLTELMNSGYSTRFLYMVMNTVFWKSEQLIDNPRIIHSFFDCFDFQKKKFSVIYRIKRNTINKGIIHIKGLKFHEELPDEIRNKAYSVFANSRNEYGFIVIEWEALDPYSAASQTTDYIETILALYRLYDHSYKSLIRSAKCIIFNGKRIYKLGKRINAVEHTKLPSSKRIDESMSLAVNAFVNIIKVEAYRDFNSIISAIKFHAHSLDSYSEENQLLDLWSLFESVLDISSKHTLDRISQVCMYLVPILKYSYIYSLFKQLADDINKYDKNIYLDIIGNADIEVDFVKRVCEFVLLDEHSQARKCFMNRCNDFPLLKERIAYYNDVLNSPIKAYRFVEKHAERVRWQIMRIYRNRNLIIHNGQKMDYLPLLIENLHSYVDDFLAYILNHMAKEKNIDSICQELFVKECKWNALFSREKKSITVEQIEYMLSM